MISKDSISADISEPDFVNVNYIQLDDDFDMGGWLCFERKSLRVVIEMLYDSLNTDALGDMKQQCGHDNFRVYESGSDRQPITNIINRRPDDVPHGGLTGLMMTRSAAEDLLKQLSALLPEAGIHLTDRLNQQLWAAASAGDSDAVISALRQGAGVNARGRYGDTALNMAAEKGHVEAVEVLLKAGADIENPDVADKTPLMSAAFAGKTKAVELLLRSGARINRDLLDTLQLKVNILEENLGNGMIVPAEVDAWRRFLDFMVERWQEQNGQAVS